MSASDKTLASASPASGNLALLAAIVVFAAITPTILMTAPAVAAQLATQWQLSPARVGDLFSVELGAMSLATLPALFERFGLAACYLLLAGLMSLALPLSRAFPSGSPPAEARASTGAVHSRLRVGLGILAVLTFYISLSGVWTFIGAIAEGAGIGAGASGEVLAGATLMGIAGAACASFIGNRLPRDLMLLGGYLAMAAAILLLIGQPPLARFALAALLFKFTWTFALPFILACLADLDRSGRLMNASNLVIGGGLAIGPALAGRLIEGSGGFLPLLPIAAGLAALSLLLALACRPR
ncbi:MFS transporter [Pseudomonas aeruginosa]|nr:MFS transporter [Pseudomonas aeruginosa]